MSLFTGIFGALKSLLTKKTTAAVIALAISALYYTKAFGKQIPTVKLNYFLAALSQNAISEVFVSGTKVLFKGLGSETWYQTNASMLTKDRLYKILNKKPNLIFSCDDVDDGKKLDNILNLALIGATLFVGYKMIDSYYNAGTTTDLKKTYTSNTRFTDIHGLDDAKKELQEIIDFLKDPAKYKAVGARLRKGVLLHGPSGTGKTLLARAIAGESNSAFLSCAASEFIELYVGVGPKRVRELFNRARQLAPCIIFIDEIDGIGTKRNKFGNIEHGGDNEKTSTLNQLLTEMDGFRENHDIVIIAATNRFPLLDDALVRSGRFDTKLKIDLPDLKDRKGIMKIHLRNKKHNISEATLDSIAEKTDKYSGADLENIVNECAYVCVQKNRSIVADSDILEAFEKINGQRNLE